MSPENPENTEISFTSELPDGIPRQGARRGKTDAALGRVRLLPVIADGDIRARPAGAGDVSRGHRHLESQWPPLAPPIPVGPAVVAEIQSNQMDITLAPLPTGY